MPITLKHIAPVVGLALGLSASAFAQAPIGSRARQAHRHQARSRGTAINAARHAALVAGARPAAETGGTGADRARRNRERRCHRQDADDQDGRRLRNRRFSTAMKPRSPVNVAASPG